MNIKKFLEQVAEEDREAQITPKDVQFLASIGVDYNKKREAAKAQPDSSYYRTKSAVNPKAAIIVVSCTFVALLAVVLILLYTFKPAPFEPPIGYFEDKSIEVDSNLQELNGDLQLFSLTIDASEYDVKTTRVYGSLSNDSFYYTLKFTANQGLSKKFTLDIVVNSNYNHKELDYINELKEVRVSDYTLKFTENLTLSDPPFSTVNCKGEIQIGTQWIYIYDYEEMVLGQSTLIETLQSLIIFK